MKTFILISGARSVLFNANDIVHAIELTMNTTYNNKFAIVREVIELENYTKKRIDIGLNVLV